MMTMLRSRRPSLMLYDDGTHEAYYGEAEPNLSHHLSSIETVLRDELGTLNSTLTKFAQDLRAARVFERTVQRNHGCERQYDRYREMVMAYMLTS